jgi:hypothetical protein
VEITVDTSVIMAVILGLVVEAVRWLLIIGLVALLIAIIAGWLGARRGLHQGEVLPDTDVR